MEENFRRSMMPAYEEFIKVLGVSFAENSSAGWNLWRLEMVLLKAVAALTVQALVLLIELTQGTGYSGARRTCGGCGGPMKFEYYRSRQLLSSFGVIKYERAYYYCRQCQCGCVPLDEELELNSRAVTPPTAAAHGFSGRTPVFRGSGASTAGNTAVGNQPGSSAPGGGSEWVASARLGAGGGSEPAASGVAAATTVAQDLDHRMRWQARRLSGW